jgi:hypothetical protein
VNKQHDILPTSPVAVFVNLATQSAEMFVTQDGDFLGFDGIAFIDSKEYNPTLVEKQNSVSVSDMNYTPNLSERIISPQIYQYLITNSNDFLRTQDGNFIIL